MKIGQCIYSARKRKGISQEELASLLDVSRQSISLWETDQTVPTLDKLQSMSKILDVSMDELTGFEPIKNSYTDQKHTAEEKKQKIKEILNKTEIGSFVLSLSSIILWYINGLGLVISILAIVLSIVCIKLKRTKLSHYGLVISIVFLFASIFRLAYL